MWIIVFIAYLFFNNFVEVFILSIWEYFSFELFFGACQKCCILIVTLILIFAKLPCYATPIEFSTIKS